MGITIKFRRGTATEHAQFSGAEGELTVQESVTEGDPWDLRVHDGLGGSGYLVPSATSVATLENKILDDTKFTGTISDNSGNLIAEVINGVLEFKAGKIALDAPLIYDQNNIKVPIEQEIARIARKNQMILGD